MKRRCISLLIVFSLLFSLFIVPANAAQDPDEVYVPATVNKIAKSTDVFNLQAKSAILIETATGNVLMEQDSHQRLPIASVTKVMSMLLVMEEIDSGKMTYDEKVTVSEYAAGYGGSQAYIEAGEQFTVRDALKAIAIHSSNDVTVVLAERVAGSEEIFVNRMNEKAKELGMKDTLFKDCVGLNTEAYSSAYDVGLMSREIITKHPGILKFTGTWRDKFRNGTFNLDNTNKLVRFYPGCDGLKTGYISKAGFCLSATAQKNGLRFIAVALGEPNSNTRAAEVRKLLDYGFANYEVAQVCKKGDEIKTVEVKKGTSNSVKGIVSSDVNLSVKKGEKSNVKKEVVIDDQVVAPVKKGQKIGCILFKLDDQKIGQVDVVADNSVERASVFRLFVRMVKDWFSLGRC